MGLLDDAIREHLELKRLRGADPSEVAREQREALDPVPRDGHSARGENQEEASDGLEFAEEASEPAKSQRREPTEGENGVSAGDFSPISQETAELDMQTVLDGHEDASSEQDPQPPLDVP
jgi:hypothetical protein